MLVKHATNQPVVDVVESMVRGMVSKGVSPLQLLIGVKNAFSFGDVLKEGNFEFSEDSLHKIHNGLEVAIKAAREIQ